MSINLNSSMSINFKRRVLDLTPPSPMNAQAGGPVEGAQHITSYNRIHLIMLKSAEKAP
jgi:hypothetical protein